MRRKNSISAGTKRCRAKGRETGSQRRTSQHYRIIQAREQPTDSLFFRHCKHRNEPELRDPHTNGRRAVLNVLLQWQLIKYRSLDLSSVINDQVKSMTEDSFLTFFAGRWEVLGRSSRSSSASSFYNTKFKFIFTLLAIAERINKVLTLRAIIFFFLSWSRSSSQISWDQHTESWLDVQARTCSAFIRVSIAASSDSQDTSSLMTSEEPATVSREIVLLGWAACVSEELDSFRLGSSGLSCISGVDSEGTMPCALSTPLGIDDQPC